MTPLHVACEWNSMDLVEYFFEIGGEKLVRLKNGEGMDSIEFSYAENIFRKEINVFIFFA